MKSPDTHAPPLPVENSAQTERPRLRDPLWACRLKYSLYCAPCDGVPSFNLLQKNRSAQVSGWRQPAAFMNSPG